MNYPEKLKRIKFYDQVNDKTIILLTNNFVCNAEIIADLYKERYKIELFFKWIKQHLHIKKFFGTSLIAVYTNLDSCLCLFTGSYYEEKLKLKQELYIILQILSVCLFENVTVNQLFKNENYKNNTTKGSNQLILLDL